MKDDETRTLLSEFLAGLAADGYEVVRATSDPDLTPRDLMYRDDWVKVTVRPRVERNNHLMSSYQGPAVAVSNGAETSLTVNLFTFQQGHLRAWRGTAQAAEPGIPNLGLDMAKLRLPDGREGDAQFDVRYDSREQHARIEVIGSGEPPFDV